MMQVIDLINVLTPVGTGLVTGVGGWFIGRRKRQADTESAELKNVKAAQAIYVQTIKDISEHVSYLETRLNTLIDEKVKLQQDLAAAKANSFKMRIRIESLEQQLKKLADEKDT